MNLCLISRSVFTQSIRYNSGRTAVTRIKRALYPRMYPTMLVLPDGATINIRYKEPRNIITLPLDLSTLTEKERLSRLARRKPKKKVYVEEDLKIDFDSTRYAKFIKK